MTYVDYNNSAFSTRLSSLSLFFLSLFLLCIKSDDDQN